ncbi:MAG: nitroreductase family protein [Anaerolineae bacterium]|nr:nitroreductase family protein [Anaerolineae bacterium]
MDLYQAIVTRRSVRRYREEPLDKTFLTMVDEIVGRARPLVSANRVRMMRRDVVGGEDLIAAMGGYGRILTPPHYLVAAIVGRTAPLVDLGYRMEQIAVQMVQLGISVCFIGSLGRETNVRVRFRLNPSARTGAFLIFGRPSDSVTGRTINTAIRRARGEDTRLEAADIFYNGNFDRSTSPPRQLTKLIEAARLAPSANNAQPWRFLWARDTLYLFVQKLNSRYGNQLVMQEYRYFDGGTCMANIMLAMENTDLYGKWELLDPRQPDLPEHPPSLEPLAKLELH